MYNDNENNNSSNYEGLFARQPDHTESTVWGGVKDTHEQPFGADIHVTKDWLGNVTDIQSGW
jgi:hypothetical protein